MFKSPWFYAVVAAAAFAIWPLVVRVVNISPGWLGLLVSAGTAAVALALAHTEGLPNTRNLIVGLLAGVINGLGMLAYSKVLGDKTIDLTRIVPIILVLVPIMVVAGGVAIYHEPFTARKLAGVGLAGVAIYLLS